MVYGAGDGVDAFLEVDGGGVADGVGAVAGEVYGVDAVGAAGFVQGGGVIYGGGHAAPNLAPNPGALSGAVD